MGGLRRDLPSLPHLDIFEAAARSLNFTKAGNELGVTQAAVSYAIRSLERDLGLALFTRDGRQVALTEAGQTLFRDVAASFANIRRSVAALRGTAHSGQVGVSASTAFATFWMLPRLPQFRQNFPAIELNLRAVDRDIDLATEGVALGVRYGPGVLANYQRALLASEVIYPICSAGFAAQHGLAAGSVAVKEIATLPLVHLLEPHRPCPTWGDWFLAQGHRVNGPMPGLRFNDYALVIRAILEGQGVSLGWHHLVERLMQQGSLVKLSAADWHTGTEYFAVWSRALNARETLVRDWLVAEAQRTEDGGLVEIDPALAQAGGMTEGRASAGRPPGREQLARPQQGARPKEG
jgi:DNA-binding transcriptional LysR family regulator